MALTLSLDADLLLKKQSGWEDDTLEKVSSLPLPNF
jgi:hypothetical protein